MKLPIILVDQGDVTVFESLKQLEEYVESPDIGGYQVYDADGMVIELVARVGQSGSSHKSIRVHDVVPVRARESEPRKYARIELKEAIWVYLESVGQRPEDNDLATLVRQLLALSR